MSAAIAPGLLPGLAPPATNAPPAATKSGGTGQPVTGQTFAEAVAAIADAAPATGSEPNALPGEAPAASTNPAEADLQTLLASLMAQLKGGVSGAGDGETKDDTPLPDRPAGAGVEQTDVGAMEALMGQLLLVRTNVEPPSGSGTSLPIVEALPSTGSATPGDAATLIEDVARMLQRVASDTRTQTVDAKALAQAAVVASDALTAQIATSNATPATPVVVMPAAPTATSASTPAALPAVAATAAPAAVTVPAGGDRDDTSSAPVDVPEGGLQATLEATQASTPRPAESAAAIRDRASRGHSAAEAPAPVANATPQAPALGAVTAVSATPKGDAKVGPVTVQIANSVQSAVLRGEHEVRLVLNPPELGRVEIKITEGNGGISVQMHAEQAGAHDLIQQQLPLLHQALESRDVRVDRLQVSHAAQGDAAQSFLDSRGFANQQQQQRDDAPEWSPMASFGAPVAEPARNAARPRIASTSGIDVMA